MTTVRPHIPNIVSQDLSFLHIGWGQYQDPKYQHNFVVVYPAGHTPQYASASERPTLDKTIVMFDFWRDLLPGVYSPQPGVGSYPTQEFLQGGE